MNKNVKLLLNTISAYCIENPDYAFWYANKSNYYRLYLGYSTTYQKFKQGCEDSYGLINSRFIKETNLVFDFGTVSNGVMSKIQTYHDWDSKDIHRYKLFTYCRERVDNEFLYINCFSTFFNSRKEPIDIEKSLTYGNFKKTKDWTFFTSNLLEEDWDKIWSNYPQISSLANYFNDNFNIKEKKEFLTPLIQSKNLKEINDQSLNFYQFLEKIFTPEVLKEYIDYSIVKKSLQNSDVFDNDEKETIIEKVVTNQNIFKLQNYETYSANECNTIYTFFINELNENEQLKKCGLITIDAFMNKKEYANVFYINRKQHSLFNKEHFKEIFIETLKARPQSSPLEALKEIIPTIVNNWYLQNMLESKPTKTNQLKI